VTIDAIAGLPEAIDAHDADHLAEVVAAIVDGILRASVGDAAMTANDALRHLRKQRLFAEMLVVGDAAARAGAMTPAVSCRYAQALIEHGHTEAALRVLDAIPDDDIASVGERDR